MKYTIIFIITISLTVFSCGGTPKSNTGKSFSPKSEEIQNDVNLSSVPEKYTEPLPMEKLSASEELNDDAVVAETKESEPEIDNKLVTETASTIEPYIAQVPETPPEPPVQVQPETPDTLVLESATLPVQTQSVQSLTQSSEQTQTQPSAQAQAQVQPQVQIQPHTQAQTQAFTEAQFQPQAQIARQPAVQAPLPLAPAEEKPAAVHENTPAQIDPPRLDTSKDEPVNPFQTVLIPQNEVIKFSRVIRAAVGQIVEIPFRGTGWIYMEELASRRGIVYESRREDSEGQSLIFRVEDTGTYALKFYRRDLIRDYVLNDYVQVIAEEAPVSISSGQFSPPVDRGRVVAQPRWPTALEEAEILRGGTSSRPAVETPLANISERGTVSSQGTVPAQDSAAAQAESSAQSAVPKQQTTQPQTVSSLPQTAAPEAAAQSGVVETPLPPDVILQRAKDAFNSGNVPSAIALLDQYSKLNSSDTDELYWLYGQFYEANSPSRNILLSLDYYRRLVREYPQSRRYNDARRRIAYLERFYINIQ